MGGLSFELPLFPLNVVLFPGMVLPLHIFEPRYRLMIRRCIEQGSPFGVVLVQPDSVQGEEHPYQIGTLAHIMTADRGQETLSHPRRAPRPTVFDGAGGRV